MLKNTDNFTMLYKDLKPLRFSSHIQKDHICTVWTKFEWHCTKLFVLTFRPLTGLFARFLLTDLPARLLQRPSSGLYATLNASQRQPNFCRVFHENADNNDIRQVQRSPGLITRMWRRYSGKQAKKAASYHRLYMGHLLKVKRVSNRLKI
ncbi:hypothetical protein Ddc_14253 [Ditylenchus destructor]|nr:hypothetical protein Ddc_14253 [Ditylenchus destructor]